MKPIRPLEETRPINSALPNESSASLTRRSFMGSLLAAGVAPLVVPSRLLGADAPSETLRIGCIGVGRMGNVDMRQARSQGRATRSQIVALCDVDSKRLQQAQDRFGEDEKPDLHEDYRKVIARDDIDGVIVCTQETWHALIGIEAARAGKGM